jgi:type VI secretion system protein ImpE
MTASELFHAGRLRDAIDAQTAKVKAQPTDQPARFFLFELFLFTGELDRARKQLDVLRYDDPRHAAAVEQYRFALDAETKRRAVFAGTEQPKWLTAIQDHIRLRLEALPYQARGESAEVRKRLDEANAAVPAITGSLNGLAFESLYDADERFGTVLEVFGTGGLYSWVPLEQVAVLTLNPPANPRDVVFRPAHLELIDGPGGDVLLPGLYPGTYLTADDAVRVGRETEWADGPVVAGIGGRVFLAGGMATPFASVTSITFGSPGQ